MVLDLLSRIAGTVFPLFALVAVGVVFARRARPALDDINRANMDIFTPALVFTILVAGDFTLIEMAPLTLATVLCVGLCAGAAAAVAWGTGLDTRVLVLATTFRNSGNIGLPLAVLAYGDAALPAATVVFVSGNLVHFLVGARLLRGAHRGRDVLAVPVVWVSLLALVIKAAGVSVPAVVMTPIGMLGDIVIPLMLFALGVRLNDADLSEWRVGVIAGVAMPLTGAVAYLLSAPWFDLEPHQAAALLAYAVLPSAVLNFMFAERYGYKPAQVASIIVISHAVALATLPLMLAWSLTHIAPL
ncbi:MAG: AEC family transporter [Pseudomonadota bacterium]